MLGEGPLPLGVARFTIDEIEDHQAAAELQGGLDAVGEPALGARLGAEPVDDHLNGVLALLVELGRAGERHHLAVDPGAGVTLALQLREQLDVLPLAPAHDRGEDLEAGAFLELENPVDDLLRRLPADRPPASRTVRMTCPCVQQSQVVVDLGDRADRGPRVAVGGFLVDRDCR